MTDLFVIVTLLVGVVEGISLCAVFLARTPNNRTR